MLETLLEAMALPNLHPALVHFPIALAVVALLFDLAALARWSEGRTAAAVLWWLAAAGGLAAYWAGRHAVDGLGMLAPEAERAVGLHSDWAWWTLLGLGSVALLRSVALTSWGGRPLIALGVMAGLSVQLLLLRTADLGGALVYQHGLAVAANTEEAKETPSATRPSGSDLVRNEDGSWTWTPAAGDRSVLGRVVEVVDPALLQLAVLRTERPGLRLRAAGRGALLLPGRFSGLRIEIDVETHSFEGSLGPAVLALSEDAGLTLEWTDPGRVALVRATGELRMQSASANVDLPAGRLALALSASHGHWKGFVAQENVVHAHGKLPDELRPAIFIRGRGELTVHRVQATQL